MVRFWLAWRCKRRQDSQTDWNMFLIAAVLGTLLVQPSYYRLKSKGYSARFFITPTVLVGMIGVCLGFLYPLATLVALAAAIVLFAVTVLLKPKEGAPGPAYLQITFDCPKCHQSISFPREREGQAALCPKCDDLIRIPT